MAIDKSDGVIVFTGNGKGKTTSAVGLAIKSIMKGLSVCYIRFMKPPEYDGEMRVLSKLISNPQNLKSFGTKGFIAKGKARPHDFVWAKQGLSYAFERMISAEIDTLVLDELHNALYFNLLSWQEVEKFLRQKPSSVALITTGRNAPEELVQIADWVVEFAEVKHPYVTGIGSRKGIEH